jgi:hypothetical protein
MARASAPSLKKKSPAEAGPEQSLKNRRSALVRAAFPRLPPLTGRAKGWIVCALGTRGRRSRPQALLAGARRLAGLLRRARLEAHDGAVMLSKRASGAECEDCNCEYQAG